MASGRHLFFILNYKKNITTIPKCIVFKIIWFMLLYFFARFTDFSKCTNVAWIYMDN